MMNEDTRNLWRDAEFRKSSHSGGQNGSCVELAWRKSSRSGQNGSCVELARTDALFGVRDSKHATGPVLTLSAERAHGFLAAVRHDRFGPA